MIWSSGLQHRKEIIDFIRAEEHFEIVEMFDYRPENLREFVTEVYKYDSIPAGFIDGKINRVTADGPEMVIIYFKHYDPDFVSGMSGYIEGVICWKSKRIGRLKEAVRKKLVPGDNMWAIPLIHGSDYEEQVDLLLKLAGRPEGIEYLYRTYGKSLPVPGSFGYSFLVSPSDQ